LHQDEAFFTRFVRNKMLSLDLLPCSQRLKKYGPNLNSR
jgi:hypothetical protein